MLSRLLGLGRQTNLMNAPSRELLMYLWRTREDRSGKIERLIFGQGVIHWKIRKGLKNSKNTKQNF